MKVADKLPVAVSALVMTGTGAGEAVAILIGLVQDSDLSSKARQPLLASLNVAYSSFQRGSSAAGANQLHAFQNKIAAQIAGTDPDLAEELITAAQQIIDAVRTSF